MKLGVFTVLLSQQPLEQALAYLKAQGAEMVEIGAGGYPGTAYCNPEKLLNSPKEYKAFERTIIDSGVTISAYRIRRQGTFPSKFYLPRCVNHIILNSLSGAFMLTASM